MKYYLDTEFHEYKKKIYSGNCATSIHQTESTPHLDYEIDTIELISIGITSEDNRDYYAICNEFDIDAAWDNEWLRENVLKHLFPEYTIITDINSFKVSLEQFGKSKSQISMEIEQFCSSYNSPDKNNRRIIAGLDPLETWILDEDIKFYAYYADYDWVVFCWLFGRMIDLPKGFPMYCIDLKQMLDEIADEIGQKMSNTQLNGLKFDRLKFIKSLDNYPKQDNEHNALDDAKWNKDLYDFLNNLI